MSRAGATARLSLVSGFLLSLCFTGCISEAVSPQTGAEATVSSRPAPGPLQHDFGVVSPGRTVETSFSLVNFSSSEWTPQQFQAGCTCLKPRVSVARVGPGETFEVLIAYTAGPQEVDDLREVTLTMAGEEGHRFAFHIKAKIRNPLSVRPTAIMWEAESIERSERKTITVGNYTQAKWNELRAESPLDWLSVAEVRPITPSVLGDAGVLQAWSVDLVLHPECIEQNGVNSVVQLTSHDGQYKSQLIVHAAIRKTLSAVPGVLVLNPAEPNSRTASTNIVFHAGVNVPDNADEMEVILPTGGIEYKIAVVGPKVWKLTINHVAESPAPLQGNIKIRVKSASASYLEIPLVVTLD